MKSRILIWLACYGLLVAADAAEDPVNRAAAIAAREEAEERWKQLNADVQSLLATQQAQQKKINALIQELKTVRDDTGKPDSRYATPEDIRHLTGKLEEMEKKRLADREMIIEQIKAMGKLLNSAPTPAPRTNPAPRETTNSGSAAIPEKGYEHTVKSGENLHLIAAAYRENGIKVTAKQIQDANEGLKPESLKVGQKIFIPDYSK